jgi:hypothetical protein
MNKSIVIICLIIIIFFLYNQMYSHNEKFYNATPSSNSNPIRTSFEAIQTISSLYNNGNFMGINGTINNFSSFDISSNNIKNSNQIITPKLCFDAAGTKCINQEMFSNLLLQASTLKQYMYLPDQSTISVMSSSYIPANDYSQLTPDKIGDGKIISALNTTFAQNYSISKWPSNDINGKYIYRTVNGNTLQSKGTGIKITVPQPPQGSNYDYEVLWIQTLNDRNSTFKVYQNVNNTTNYFGSYATGIRMLNNISPDGSMHNERWDRFEWYPVPINLKDSREIIISNFYSTDTWFSGFAFSSNPWKHCRVSALSVHWQTNISSDPNSINNTNPAITWHSENWYNDPLAQFISNTYPEIRIPFVNSGRDKIFYIIEHNNSWGPGMIDVSIQVGSTWKIIGNLYTSFDNPFAIHFNSKIYQRYLGVVIPRTYLTGLTDFMSIRLNVPYNSGSHFYFREVGTHDANPMQIIS